LDNDGYDIDYGFYAIYQPTISFYKAF